MQQRLIKWFRNLRLNYKFFSIQLLTLLLLFFGMMSTMKMTDQVHADALYRSTMQILNLFSQNVQAELDKIEDYSFTFLRDENIQNNLTRMRKSAHASIEWINARKLLNDRITELSTVSNGVNSIWLHTADGMDFYRKAEHDSFPATLMAEHIDAVRTMRGRSLWITDTTSSRKLYLMRDIREIDDLRLTSMAVMALNVDIGSLVDKCSASLSQMGMPLECAIDLNGMRVYSSHQGLPSDEFPASGYKLCIYDNEELFCVRYTPPGSIWSYTAAIPYNDIISSVRRVSKISIGVAVAVLIVALLLGSLLTNSIVRHFKALSKKYNAFAQGNWHPEAAVSAYEDRRDEIGALHLQFDHMATEYQHMIEENYIKQQFLLEAQLQQLRSQISPHFLYNTLESIGSLAEIDQNDRIATMTNSLGKLLRYTLKERREVITIGEDLRIAQEYMNIQLIRYQTRLFADFYIDEALMDALIPAMTLQPLVENAILHAAEEMLEPCHISVYCEAAGKYLDVIVQDNGPGMDEEIISKLESGQVKPDGLGIGLSNIHKRVQLIFRDEQCGLRVSCENGKTKVIVRLPGKEKCYD